MRKKSRFKKITVIVVGAAVAAAPFFVLTAVDARAIALGVSVDGVRIGGKSIGEAEAALAARFARANEMELSLKIGDAVYRASARDTGIVLLSDQTAQRAYVVGRSGNALRDGTAFLRAAVFGIPLEPALRTDEARFAAFIRETLDAHEHPAQNASAQYDPTTERFLPTKEQSGTVVDRDRLRNDIVRAMRTPGAAEIAVPVRDDQPRIVLSAAVVAADAANKILAKAPVVTTYQRNSAIPSSVTRYAIAKAQLADMMYFVQNGGAFAPDINEKRLTEWLMQIAPSINENPRDAVLAFRNGKVEEFSLSGDGKELDVAQSARSIKNTVLFGTNGSVPLVVTTIHPVIRTETIENLGLTALLATGESDFAGSPSARAFNLKLGAQKLNGVIIKPEEEFSFVDTVGEIGPKEGYRAALVIKGGKTVPEYGGGMCQVSTTMFRAAINAGLKITERFPHSLPVQYYNPQGFDAAIYGPHPDLKFINDTGANILVQTKVKGTKLIFEFYGSLDGREVKVIGPVEYDKKPDGSLKTTLTREIYRDGELIATDVFKSSYRSPKTDIIQKNPLE